MKIHGHICKVCDFDFDATYGADLAHQYIEIHHTRSITELHGQVIDPAVDLAPMCANCHKMAHRRTVAIVSIEELQNRVRHYRRTSAL
ncbi:hypothetical protein PLANPX_4833 [Lacipirellula parvula]|uniref:Uncharacterized protein n=1 Tax=Lacipirellula parvula TaxID=2650471 RepID=A0A5K7XJI7_9BACT|nr:hypothetical protein PLANPX_4833 [Lacipirellula parvula]